MVRAYLLGKQIIYGGFLGLCLSIFFSEFTSQYLYAHYQSWSGWRTMTGSDPNFLTSIVQKISWAILFVSSWFMIWKLDSFFRIPVKVTNPSDNKDDEFKPESSYNRDDKRKSKEKEIESSEINENQEEPSPTSEPEQDSKKFLLTRKDLEYAKILGLEEPFELEEIKPRYRKIIAQYHPDRVTAMGPEIKEVAEKKAKEINEAYEHLRKTLNLS